MSFSPSKSLFLQLPDPFVPQWRPMSEPHTHTQLYKVTLISWRLVAVVLAQTLSLAAPKHGGACSAHTHTLFHSHTLTHTGLPWQHVIKSNSLPGCVDRKHRATNRRKAGVCLCSPALSLAPSAPFPLFYGRSFSPSHLPPLCRCPPPRESTASFIPPLDVQGISLKLPEVQTQQRQRRRC